MPDTLHNLGAFSKQAWFSGKLGKEVVKELLIHDAQVYLAAWNPEKTEGVIKELTEATGKTAVFLGLDLGDLKSVKATTEGFLSGVTMVPHDMFSVQGYDYHVGVNVLGHFYLTKLLLPALLPIEGKRQVLTTSSSATYLPLGDKILFDTLKNGPARKRKSPTYLYFQSKAVGSIRYIDIHVYPLIVDQATRYLRWNWRRGTGMGVNGSPEVSSDRKSHIAFEGSEFIKERLNASSG
ncbi:hypothetical protein IW261DRAFT_1684451 [Armillaria novae-zelandiae]|uniref:NAD(P)-binding protein n=1 Tax=Armillaria novae-zelandiae TaxID=153914 RepID=A0AA39PAR4_9AGAR|nr:hypothetical protein IW261DRAFT_1684451 [Armillaria novae-zelandiae]